jgi:hypothetical protein
MAISKTILSSLLILALSAGATEAATPAHAHTQASLPAQPGQDAFGAIQEVVQMLQADPHTDWRRVNLEALRTHLIDMNEVTLNAAAVAENLNNGIRVAVTGPGRTRDAIQRMVPAQAAQLNGYRGWHTDTSPLPDGVLLTVTAPQPAEAQRLHALGFIGVMAQGGHHQAHHWALANGRAFH